MAPVPLSQEIRWAPVAVVVGHVVASVLLSGFVGSSLYRSFRALGPAQDTRERRAQRAQLIPVFAGLAALSLVSALYSTFQHTALSYKVWAGQRWDEAPFRLQENGTTVYLGARWLTDTPIILDTVEILAEKARRFWWAQQLDLGLVSWNLLLAIEGRRRNIPLLWAYALLGQLVSLAFAQNLFFVALLLTPSPLPPQGGGLPVSRYIRIRDAIFRPKPSNWTPHLGLGLSVLTLHFATVTAVPLFVNTPALLPLVIAGRATLLAPLALPYVVPETWGTLHAHPHQAYREYSVLFRYASFASLALHGKATIVGLAFNAPDEHYHRHSIHLPFDVEKRSSWERTASAFGRIIGATSDHPIVSGAGADVLLSAVSLGFWVAVRATDLQDILISAIPFYKRPGDTPQDNVLATPVSTRKVKGRATGSQSGDSVGRQSARRKGRGRKSKQDTESIRSDALYEPTASEAASVLEGDVLPEPGHLDWEAAALIWGFIAAGGLGVGSAGVLGVEDLSPSLQPCGTEALRSS